MKENSESALSTNKEAISNATRNLMESSILAQDERWRHALHMQVGREVVFPVADGWLFKFAVKSQGSTLDRRWKLPSWSTVGAEGISGGAVKCVEIGKNTNGESTLLGRH
ncbi:hypothetical protein VNO80_34459 [Phaseolus coccineus]|uniref:Uncharacterized protein n=1 Tax=Phaseolus coccineus TaxID=3886 RepID=A0AAN9KX01_PHACN